MTTTIRVVFISITILLSCSALGAPETEYCDSDNHMQQVQCISRNIKNLDKDLNINYQAALAALPEVDNQDSRKQKDQLRKSQRAWLKYKDENCTLIGGLEGGNNLWVTHFAALCEVDAITERTKFLKGIANGTGKP